MQDLRCHRGGQGILRIAPEIESPEKLGNRFQYKKLQLRGTKGLGGAAHVSPAISLERAGERKAQPPRPARASPAPRQAEGISPGPPTQAEGPSPARRGGAGKT